VSERAQHESGLARFVVPQWRARFRQSLDDPNRRQKLTRAFAHFERKLDERSAAGVPSALRNADAVHRMLVDAGAPERCHVLATTPLDGREAGLHDALVELMWAGEGFISCIPGRLGLYVGEDGSSVFLLRRPPAPSPVG
jgi:hypothetical protein